MKLGFIGTGNMASAIMGGIIKNNVIPAEEIIGADLFAPGRERVQKEYGINVTADNKEVAQKAETIILSVKPQFYESVIADIKDQRAFLFFFPCGIERRIQRILLCSVELFTLSIRLRIPAQESCGAFYGGCGIAFYLPRIRCNYRGFSRAI